MEKKVYEGHGPYVFLSYSHKDDKRVKQIIYNFENQRVRIWYDTGISGATEWGNIIAQHIEDCAVMIAFISENYIDSPDCKAEFNKAIACKKTILPCYLDGATLDKGSEMYVLGVQAIRAQNRDSSEVVQDILDSEFCKPCLDDGIKPQLMPDYWGPERPLFSRNKPAPYVTFNSWDNIEEGDYENFLKCKRLGLGEEDYSSGYIKVVPGETYEFRVDYENMADYELNEKGVGIAKNVVANAQIPDFIVPYEEARAQAAIISPFSKPPKVWSSLILYTEEQSAVGLEYVTASAKIHNKGYGTDGTVLADNFFNNGIFLGVNKLDGRLPSGEEYAGFITFQFKARKMKVEFTQMMSVDGENYYDEVSAKAGDILTVKLLVKHEGTEKMIDTTVFSRLPAGLSLVSGTTYCYEKVNGRQDLGDSIDKNGYNLGILGHDLPLEIYYKVRVEESAVGDLVSTGGLFYRGGKRESKSIIHIK